MDNFKNDKLEIFKNQCFKEIGEIEEKNLSSDVNIMDAFKRGVKIAHSQINSDIELNEMIEEVKKSITLFDESVEDTINSFINGQDPESFASLSLSDKFSHLCNFLLEISNKNQN